ncbi:MAG: ABC transporter permease subunit, partial [Candidatus Rokuibacteriota bacterium]
MIAPAARARRPIVPALGLASLAAGLRVLPWHARPDGAAAWWLALSWDASAAPAAALALGHGRASLALLSVFALAAAVMFGVLGPSRGRGRVVAALGLGGVAVALIQGFAVRGQAGMGVGAALAVAGFLLLGAEGMAAAGALRGDRFATVSLLAIALLVALFVFLPLGRMLGAAVLTADGGASLSALWSRLTAEKIWTLACLTSGRRCGVAWNTLLLAVLCATGTTALGLALALLVTRTALPFRRVTRLITILPVVTPPFVIGLGIILICGRAGVVNAVLEQAFGVPPTRWIYGLPGLLLAQLFAFTPVAFLVLVGVVEGVSPTLEEAGQTLGARSGAVFRTVSLPLMAPGLANAFLVGFVESIADFGNALVLGGNYGVLATEVYFALVGAQFDQGQAAALAIILLGFAVGAFALQRRVVRGRAFTAFTGKGDPGIPAALPRGLVRLIVAVAVPWIAVTVIIYAMAVLGGFVEVWGR